MKIFKLSLLIVIIMSSLFGCKAKDEEAPVITSVSLNEETIIVEASDNIEIDGFLIQEFSERPILITAENENWQSDNKLITTEDGTYYVWVKDSSGNISEYDEPINITLHLAKRFDHLNWLTPAEGTKVVDGVTYNLAELKAEYGDLYRFAEPLTEEEIESRFEYIAKFFEVLKENRSKYIGDVPWYILGGVKSRPEFDTYISEFRDRYCEKLATTDDELLSNFNGYFGYSETFSSYVERMPESFTSQLGYRGVGTDIIDEVSFSEKDFFVRYFTNEYEHFVRLYEQFNLKIEYPIENLD